MEETPPPAPPQPNDEANQKLGVSSEETPPPAPPQPKTEECNPSKPSELYLWWKVWWPRGKTAWLLFGEMVTLLWAVALWDSYRPKITISPGGTFDSKSPFKTIFIVQNQGSLPIANITYRSQLTMIPAPGSTNEVTRTEQNVSVISQMKSLESYALSINYSQIKIKDHNSPPPTNQGAPQIAMQVGRLLLSFDVSYEPKFIGKRTDTLFFVGAQDVDGNWQWFPSAHNSITDQTIDTNLIPQIQPIPVTVATPTNGGTQVHTN